MKARFQLLQMQWVYDFHILANISLFRALYHIVSKGKCLLFYIIDITF